MMTRTKNEKTDYEFQVGESTRLDNNRKTENYNFNERQQQQQTQIK